jgi:hypothetical protein
MSYINEKWGRFPQKTAILNSPDKYCSSGKPDFSFIPLFDQL